MVFSRGEKPDLQNNAAKDEQVSSVYSFSHSGPREHFGRTP